MKKSYPANVDVIVGSQWGDEGKGKLVDIVSRNYDICARVAGGSNAGHTIVVNVSFSCLRFPSSNFFVAVQNKKYKFHLVPSGILHPHVKCVVGNGVVIHLRGLLREMQELKDAGVQLDGRLLISDRAHIVFDFHQAIDGYNERNLGGKKLGTTLKGIGPAYGSKVMRNGLRVGDLQDMEYFESRLRSLAAQIQRTYPGLEIDVEQELAYYRSIRDQLLPMITDTVLYCNEAIQRGEKILIEGANATSKLELPCSYYFHY